ncbi:hypothetical protein SKAU_G00088470 [Synaphobranchus kaupii]|uniref:Uncharacterized protein n=1 Tax=Synaphobranchus kaupii TaxID=118154 RepID=A0A9Q1FWS3_SYNKA|nr:hypothetical protein SKAU_G00088470 [Synaphobranchus kaupii]
MRARRVVSSLKELQRGRDGGVCQRLTKCEARIGCHSAARRPQAGGQEQPQIPVLKVVCAPVIVFVKAVILLLCSSAAGCSVACVSKAQERFAGKSGSPGVMLSQTGA